MPWCWGFHGAWRFDAKTERMNAEQRQLFEETLAADQADLEAQLAALKAASKELDDATDTQTRRQPKRQACGERVQAQRTKSRKDVAQAAALLDYLLVNDTAAIAAMNGLYAECDFAAKMAQATE